MVVLTAEALEYEAVRVLLADVRKREHISGTRFDTGTLPGSPWAVAMAEMGSRNHRAGLIVEQAVNWLRPSALFFIGFAGGLKPGVSMGDVVVATRIYDARGDSRSSGGFLTEPHGLPSSHRLEQAARASLRSGWNLRHSAAVAHFGAIAAVHTTRPQDAMEASTAHPDAMAVELWSTGLGCCRHLIGSSPWLTIRGITDDNVQHPVKRLDCDLRPEAAANAAAAAATILSELSPWQTPFDTKL